MCYGMFVSCIFPTQTVEWWDSLLSFMCFKFSLFKLYFEMLVGGGLGLFMGLFLGALDNPITHQEMSGREQFIYTAKQMGSRSWSSCKTFAVMGLVFSAAECVVEKVC